MAAGKPHLIRYEPGRLVIGPTDLSTAYPFGGTQIGLAKEILFAPNRRRVRIVAEEFGGRTVRSSFTQKSPRLVCAMRGWDADFVAMLPDGASGSSGKIVPASSSAGALFTQRVLLLVPEEIAAGQVSVASSTSIGLLLYAASVLEDETARRRHGWSHEHTIPVEWEAELDGSNRDYHEGLLSGMTLP